MCSIQYGLSRRLWIRNIVPTPEQRYQVSNMDGMRKTVKLDRKSNSNNIDVMLDGHMLITYYF